MTKIAGWKKNILAVVIGCGITLALLEVTIRVFPRKFILYLPMSDNLQCSGFDRRVGLVFTPQQSKRSWNNACLTSYPIATNSLGFRDSEWRNDGSFKIALLGDSIIAGLEVSEGDYPAAILRRLLKRAVLNTGVVGYGQVNELLVYRKILRDFTPQVVVLFMFPENDISDNSCALAPAYYRGVRIPVPCAYISGNEIKLKSDYSRVEIPKAVLKDFLEHNCRSVLFLYRLINHRILIPLLHGTPDKGGLGYYGVFVPAEKQEWKDGWFITEKLLVDLRKDVEGDGAKFLVVLVHPALIFIKGDAQIKEYIRRNGILSAGFQADYPLRKSRDILQRNGIAFLELAPYFAEYKEKFHLQFPFFSYWCDGHWNPLGHFLASNIVAKYLVDHNWIPLSDEEREKIVRKIDDNLILSPRAILGEEAYKQIYGHGFCTGSSGIDKIMQEN